MNHQVIERCAIFNCCFVELEDLGTICRPTWSRIGGFCFTMWYVYTGYRKKTMTLWDIWKHPNTDFQLRAGPVSDPFVSKQIFLWYDCALEVIKHSTSLRLHGVASHPPLGNSNFDTRVACSPGTRHIPSRACIWVWAFRHRHQRKDFSRWGFWGDCVGDVGVFNRVTRHSWFWAFNGMVLISEALVVPWPTLFDDVHELQEDIPRHKAQKRPNHDRHDNVK